MVVSGVGNPSVHQSYPIVAPNFYWVMLDGFDGTKKTGHKIAYIFFAFYARHIAESKYCIICQARHKCIAVKTIYGLEYG